MEQISIGTSGLTTSRIDAAAKVEIDAILQHCVTDPVSPEFTAPPARRPSDQGVRRHA
jgi:hypothetical protein